MLDAVVVAELEPDCERRSWLIHRGQHRNERELAHRLRADAFPLEFGRRWDR